MNGKPAVVLLSGLLFACVQAPSSPWCAFRSPWVRGGNPFRDDGVRAEVGSGGLVHEGVSEKGNKGVGGGVGAGLLRTLQSRTRLLTPSRSRPRRTFEIGPYGV